MGRILFHRIYSISYHDRISLYHSFTMGFKPDIHFVSGFGCCIVHTRIDISIDIDLIIPIFIGDTPFLEGYVTVNTADRPLKLVIEPKSKYRAFT